MHIRKALIVIAIIAVAALLGWLGYEQIMASAY